MSSAERLLTAMAEGFPDDYVEMNPAVIDAMIAALAPIAADDFVTVMTGPDNTFETARVGADGLREAWVDWLAAFDRVRFEIEAVEEIGDNVLMLGRQVGTTRHGGVEIEQPSAAVWKFRDGKIVQVEFHLDRERAYGSAREPVQP